MLLHGHGNSTIMIFLSIVILPIFLVLGGPLFSNNDDQTCDVMDLDPETM